MGLDRTHVGLEGAPFELDVERGKIAEFARATRADHPAYFRRDGALVPPTFFTTMFHWTTPDADPLSGQLWDRSRSLQAAQAFTFPDRVPTAGTRLVGRSRVDAIEPTTARGRHATRIVLTTSFRDEDDRVAATSTLTVVELGVRLDDASAAERDDTAGTGSSDHPLDTWDFGELDLTDIVRFEGVVGVWNPIHHDLSAARAAGFDDIISIGMLPASLLATLAVRHADPARVRRFEARFHQPVLRGDHLRLEVAGAGDDPNGLTLACRCGDRGLAVSARASFAPASETRSGADGPAGPS